LETEDTHDDYGEDPYIVRVEFSVGNLLFLHSSNIDIPNQAITITSDVN
jgi:hypothetical protein